MVDLPEIVNTATAEVVRRARAVYVVSTPEFASLKLSKQRCQELSGWGVERDGSTHCSIAAHKTDIGPQEAEQILGCPVAATFPNDYKNVRRATTDVSFIDTAFRARRSVPCVFPKLTGGGGREEVVHGAVSEIARRKFSLAAAAMDSSVSPRSSASLRAVSTTNAGSFRLPRLGTGARYGASVSTRMRSAGATRRGFLNVRALSETSRCRRSSDRNPDRGMRSASAGLPEKQCMMPGSPAGAQCSSISASVSSQASRVWITMGLRASRPCAFAR